MQARFYLALASLALSTTVMSVPAWAGAAPDAAQTPAPAPPAAGKAPAAQPKPPAPPTEAELKCQAEAVAAVDKQRKAGQFRMQDTCYFASN